MKKPLFERIGVLHGLTVDMCDTIPFFENQEVLIQTEDGYIVQGKILRKAFVDRQPNHS